PAFLDSSYIRYKELPALAQNAAERSTVVIPVVVRRADVEAVTIKYPDSQGGPHEVPLISIQAINTLSRPLNSLPQHEVDNILLALANRIKEVVRTIKSPVIPPTSDVSGGHNGQGARAQVDIAKASFEMVSERMNEPRIQEAIVRFQTDFRSA